MSLETWKQEFYPTPASNPDCSPAEHSLRKWRCLLPRNLQKHGCRIRADGVMDIHHAPGDEGLPLNDDTCALCHIHICICGDCTTCPLFKAGFGCMGESSLYMNVLDGKKPVSAMVSALRKAVKIEKAESKKGTKTK